MACKILHTYRLLPYSTHTYTRHDTYSTRHTRTPSFRQVALRFVLHAKLPFTRVCNRQKIQHTPRDQQLRPIRGPRVHQNTTHTTILSLSNSKHNATQFFLPKNHLQNKKPTHQSTTTTKNTDRPTDTTAVLLVQTPIHSEYTARARHDNYTYTNKPTTPYDGPATDNKHQPQTYTRCTTQNTTTHADTSGLAYVRVGISHLDIYLRRPSYSLPGWHFIHTDIHILLGWHFI